MPTSSVPFERLHDPCAATVGADVPQGGKSAKQMKILAGPPGHGLFRTWSTASWPTSKLGGGPKIRWPSPALSCCRLATRATPIRRTSRTSTPTPRRGRSECCATRRAPSRTRFPTSAGTGSEGRRRLRPAGATGLSSPADARGLDASQRRAIFFPPLQKTPAAMSKAREWPVLAAPIPEGPLRAVASRLHSPRSRHARLPHPATSTIELASCGASSPSFSASFARCRIVGGARWLILFRHRRQWRSVRRLAPDSARCELPVQEPRRCCTRTGPRRCSERRRARSDVAQSLTSRESASRRYKRYAMRPTPTRTATALHGALRRRMHGRALFLFLGWLPRAERSAKLMRQDEPPRPHVFSRATLRRAEGPWRTSRSAPTSCAPPARDARRWPPQSQRDRRRGPHRRIVGGSFAWA